MPTIRWCTPRTRCSPNERGPRWAPRVPGDGAPSWSRCCRQHPLDHLSDRLRLASLALDSDAPQPVAEVVDAAQQALRLGDLTLAERLARSALERSSGTDALAARLPLANALAWQGRGREADALLAAVDSAALSEPELMAWTLLRAANQFFMLSEPERATAFLQTIRNRVPDIGPRITLDALSATFAMNAGNIGQAVEIAHDGAGLTGGRRPGGGLGGQRGHAVFGAAGPVRRRRAAGAARPGRRASRAAAVHGRAGPDHRPADGGPARRGERTGAAVHRLRRIAAAGPRDRRGAARACADRRRRIR